MFNKIILLYSLRGPTPILIRLWSIQKACYVQTAIPKGVTSSTVYLELEKNFKILLQTLPIHEILL